MPYITQLERDKYDPLIVTLAGKMKVCSSTRNMEGSVNYVITKLIKELFWERKPSYETYNAMIGALECAKLELYRRKVSVYEDTKIQMNGDVI